MTDQMQETPAQVGRYLATTHLLRAIIDLVAELAERDAADVRAEIKTRVDNSTAILRLGASGRPEFEQGIQKMDLAIKAVLTDSAPEVKN